ncbi:MAG TPA: hypothetical protein VFK26_03520 [Gemmatimonadaceae bacterium]|jgi:hypothetical protein|nr:hypothetical protein [Gemmatimonadaceae bacterium]
MRFSLRQLVLALVLFGIIGLEIELAFLRHADSLAKWIPHISLLIGLVVTLAVYLSPRKPVLRSFQTIMVLYLLIGALGVYFHLRGNVEFAVERDPSLSGLKLLWKALRGATPALAPGALAQLGLLGLLYTYGHPSLAANAAERRDVD